TRGFVGADLESLCREAAYNSIRRTFGAEQLEHGDISLSEISKLKVTNADFELALSKIKPSALREVIVEMPKVRWSDIGGLEDIKQLLKENVEYAIKKRESFDKMGIKPVKGILLHGPPGTGKTLLAMAIANECSANFISVKGPEVFSKWLGESEENIRFIFSKAREVAPCIIFFDEIDAVAARRGSGYGGEGENAADRVVNQILTEMDGIESLDRVVVLAATNRESLDRVVVLAATNRIDMIDPALLRPGRFDYTISVPMPDFEARKSIFRIHTRSMPIAEIDLDELAKNSEGFAGSDIMAVCREAGMQALRRNSFEPTKVTKKDFSNALEKVKKTMAQLKKETEYAMIYGGPVG
ncbi:MAG: AAA family ATPase, partial [Thermoplasmata archaeon]